ncbi:MAG: ATP-binding cassette domain-containing protein [Chitinophagales bacterium]|nr:ATP-binding cassette domain-containing protein [Chitinophagales bacterium]
MSKIIARVENLNLRYRNKLLQEDLSFTWEKNQIWCVTGPTGSGKTTFLKTIAGILFSSGASVEYPYFEILKKNTHQTNFISEWIAFVPQEIKIPTCHYIEDLYYQRRFQAAEQDDIPTTKDILLGVTNDEKIIENVANQMELVSMLSQPFVQLSNGQTRRLMIAIALCKQPQILILDNPYTGLDQSAREKLNEILKRMINQGIPILIAAHEHELPKMHFITNTLRLKSVMECQDNIKALSSEFILNEMNGKRYLLQMKNIKVQYGKKIVLDIPEWSVKYGENWVIQGKNGSGKSTLLSVIMADHPQAYSNEFYLFGRKRGSGESIWEIKSRIGYFSPELLRYIEPRNKSVDLILSNMNNLYTETILSEEEKKMKAETISQWLGIYELLGISVGDLSLGQQKMILIASAMVRNPELIILDEPLQGMDIQWREHFKRKISQFAQNRTVLYVTHDKEEIPDGHWKTLSL